MSNVVPDAEAAYRWRLKQAQELLDGFERANAPPGKTLEELEAWRGAGGGS